MTIWWRLHNITKQPILTLNYFAVNFLLHRILPCCNWNILLLIVFAVDRENWFFSLLSVLLSKVGVPSSLSLSWQEIIIIILIIILSVSGGSSVVAFLQLFLSGSKTCAQSELQLSLWAWGAALGDRMMSCVTWAVHPKVAFILSISLTLLTPLLHLVTLNYLEIHGNCQDAAI